MWVRVPPPELNLRIRGPNGTQVVRKLLLDAYLHGAQNLGEILDALDQASPAQRRQMLDEARVCGDLRALAVSEEEGTAYVDLPLRVELEEGKEIVRDKEGRPQGVVERTFAAVSWDRSQSA